MAGGWARSDMDSSEQRTHYPRQSHHNHQFSVVGGTGNSKDLQSVTAKRVYENQGKATVPCKEHIRTQANTFGLNSNSIASSTSQLFEQTHSSNGFGSTFMSSN